MNCLIKHVIEGKIEGRLEETARRGRSSYFKERQDTGN
jgi:hypothetical protein